MMNLDFQSDMDRAVALFQQQRYRDAFLAFAELYNVSEVMQERQQILDILTEAYYQPNAAEMENCYQSNIEALKAYPYVFGEMSHEPEHLGIQMFPVDDGEFFTYDKVKQRFSSHHVHHKEWPERYLFKDLSKQLFLEDETEPYHLRFLYDNVRRSEDFGGDNHIYLYYSSAERLGEVLLSYDIRPLLKDEKFVFLLGEKHKNCYPINFKKRFQLDFKSMGPKPIRIDELKRVCFWYKHAYSGTTLCTGVIRALSNVQYEIGYTFHTDSTIDHKPMYFSTEFQQVMGNPNRTFTVKEISDKIGQPNADIRISDLEDYLDWLRENREPPCAYTISELFRGYFLFHYQRQNLNPRISPMLLYDPHMWDTHVYNALIMDFPYHIVMTSMRDPIVTFARSYEYGLVGWNEFQTKYLLASDYEHTCFLNEQLLKNYWCFRFEDLKKSPEVTCRAICKCLNLPFENAMLTEEAPLTDRQGNTVRGFDQAPLHRNINHILSEFDQMRLKIFYEPIHKYYGYPSFDSEEYPLPAEEVRLLMSYPLRFERSNKKKFSSAPEEKELHKWIQEILQTRWGKQIKFPQLIPLE